MKIRFPFSSTTPRILILSVFIAFFSSTQVFAQTDSMRIVNGKLFEQQVGYSQPELFKSLLDYRLPNWGYTVFTLDGSSNGAVSTNLNDIKSNDGVNERKDESGNSNLSLTANPTYINYFESEDKQVNLSISSPFNVRWNYGSNGVKTTNRDYDAANYNTNMSISPLLNYSQKKYFKTNSDDFLLYSGALQTGLGFGKSMNKSTEKLNGNVQPKTRNESFNSSNTNDLRLSFGYGQGRIRNVTPILRAIRFTDRLNALGKFEKLNQNQIQLVAQQFSKQGAYSQTGFRSDKYFWDDVFSQSGISESISPFEVNYLQEVPLENLGSRYEGSSWSSSIELRAKRTFQKSDVSSLNTANHNVTTNLRKTIGASWVTNYEYYKNFSLEWQYSHYTNLLFGADKVFWNNASENPTTYLTSIYHSQSILKSIADKWLINGSANVAYSYSSTKYENVPTNIQNQIFTIVNLGLSAQVDYFIERSTLIQFSANSRYTINLWDDKYENKIDYYSSDKRYFNISYYVTIKHFFGGNVW